MDEKVPNPGWITDKAVDVDIDSLHAFAKAIQAELDQNVKPNISAVLHQLAGKAGYTPGDYTSVSAPPHNPGANPTFGLDPIQDVARKVGEYHQQCERKAQELLNNLALGLQAIAWAAQGIATEYQSVDELNHMDLEKVKTYFTAGAGDGSLADEAARRGSSGSTSAI